MEPFTFIPLGVGDAFSAKHYSSCLWLEAAGSAILIDCPHPIRKMMREAGARARARLDINRVEAVALTHLHADHASGLEGFGYFAFFALKRRARLLAHPDVVARLWDGHLAAGMEQLLVKRDPPPWETTHKELADYFEYTALSEAGVVRCGPFEIECRRTIHHIPTTAFRIRTAGRDGRCLGYSADTAFDPTLIAWLDEANLVVHETNYGVHTPYADLAALPASLRAKMRLIHYPDDFDLAASAIEPLREGTRYVV